MNIIADELKLKQDINANLLVEKLKEKNLANCNVYYNFPFYRGETKDDLVSAQIDLTTMRKLFFTAIIILSTISAFAQNTSVPPNQNISTDSTVVYRLFSTKNLYTFIKLDTRNGRMWQVQWSTGDNTFQVPLSLTSRVSVELEKNGRFFLVPTTNIYNFILLDQIDGRVWQVQWNIEAKDRLVLPIY